MGKVLPEAGPVVCAIVALQLSLTVGAAHETVAEQAAPAFTLMFTGQPAMAGAVASCTVTMAIQVAVAPALSVTVSCAGKVPELTQVKMLGIAMRLTIVPSVSKLPPSIMAPAMGALPLAFKFTVMAWQIAVGGAFEAR